MKAYCYVLGVIVAICAAWFAVDLFAGDKVGLLENTPLAAARAQGRMPALDGAVEWLNTKPLSAAALRGKVVLVDCWTYSCINWQRTLPHVRAWFEKYKDKGLVVGGVHTPESGFVKDVSTSREPTARLNMPYLVVVDSNRTIWQAFGNAYWPALYIVDAKGKIRHTHFGEAATKGPKG
ncbi:MAG: hypothetical protein JWQ76_2429 [Ramlibacter sp.]|nr:hypothetical protein [Ramlibacter sp.]